MDNKINIYNISRLRTFSDGDGVSTLIGSRGCTLRCAYCINPGTWNTEDKNPMSINELYETVKRDNIYFLATNGGIVFGGGEPLIHSKFIKEFIKKYQNTNWKFRLETCLNIPRKNIDDIIDYIDFYIIDIKDLDKKRYETYTNGNYDLFYSNLKYLLEKVGPDKIHVRVPKINQLHQSNEAKLNYEKLKSMGFKNIEIFSYVMPEDIKEIPKQAIENRDHFIEKLK